MSKMPAVVQFELKPGSVDLREMPVPEPGETDVVLRVNGVGVCGSDVHQYHNSQSWSVRVPVILGHEFCGTIAKAGKAVKGFAEGDFVASETAAHVNAEKFKASLGFDAVHVPLKGTPEILLEIVSGRVQFAFVPLVASVGPIRDGKVVALGVSTPKRSPTLPDVPTMAETGYPGGEYNFWVGVLAPAGTPKPILDKVSADIGQALHLPDVNEKMVKQGQIPIWNTPEQFTAIIKSDTERYGKILQDAGVTPK